MVKLKGIVALTLSIYLLIVHCCNAHQLHKRSNQKLQKAILFSIKKLDPETVVKNISNCYDDLKANHLKDHILTNKERKSLEKSGRSAWKSLSHVDQHKVLQVIKQINKKLKKLILKRNKDDSMFQMLETMRKWIKKYIGSRKRKISRGWKSLKDKWKKIRGETSGPESSNSLLLAISEEEEGVIDTIVGGTYATCASICGIGVVDGNVDADFFDDN